MPKPPVSWSAASFVISAGLLWGTVAVIVRVLVRDVNPGLIAFIRILLGGTVMSAVLLLTSRRNVLAPNWSLVVLASVGMSMNYFLFTLGLKFTLASAAAMVVQSEVIFLVVLSVLLLGEPFGPTKALGMGMALAGVLLITWNGESLSGLLASRYLLGNLIVFVAGFFWAVYAYAQKMLTKGPDIIVSLSPIFLLSSIILLPLAWGSLPTLLKIGGRAILSLLYLGIICTGVAYILLAEGMKRIPASTVGILTTVMPVTSVVLASMFLHEELTVYIILGAFLDLGGIVMVVRSEG